AVIVDSSLDPPDQATCLINEGVVLWIVERPPSVRLSIEQSDSVLVDGEHALAALELAVDRSPAGKVVLDQSLDAALEADKAQAGVLDSHRAFVAVRLALHARHHPLGRWVPEHEAHA